MSAVHGSVHVFHEHDVADGRTFWASVNTRNGAQSVHAHDFVEVEIVADGRGFHTAARGRRRIEAGDVFILRPGTWHSYHGCHDLVLANVSLSPSALTGTLVPGLRELLYRLPNSDGAFGVYWSKVPPIVAANVVEQIRSLCTAVSSRSENDLHMTGRLLSAFGTLSEALPLADRRQCSNRAVSAACSRLEADYARHWTVAELAACVGLHPAYLTRLFRRHVGQSPMGYLAQLRAESAAALLAEDQSIADVGVAVGWPDPAYFSRRFRSVYGLSPSQFRKYRQAR